VSGFWHGASWNFIAWGFIHACGFLPLLLLNRNRKHVSDVVAQDRKLPNFKEIWQMSTTFAFVTFAWIFFRADSIDTAVNFIKHIGASIIEHPGQFLMLPSGKMAFVYIIPIILGDWYLRRDERILSISYKWNVLRNLIYFIISYFIFLFLNGSDESSSFIYFQF
jgi:D-alanyl-lipoteichoic acid acyltransferase DltB (MBOAT superfamily)